MILDLAGRELKLDDRISDKGARLLGQLFLTVEKALLAADVQVAEAEKRIDELQAEVTRLTPAPKEPEAPKPEKRIQFAKKGKKLSAAAPNEKRIKIKAKGARK